MSMVSQSSGLWSLKAQDAGLSKLRLMVSESSGLWSLKAQVYLWSLKAQVYGLSKPSKHSSLWLTGEQSSCNLIGILFLQLRHSIKIHKDRQ